jgi:hypothetical protein
MKICKISNKGNNNNSVSLKIIIAQKMRWALLVTHGADGRTVLKLILKK